jgi:large subunit ribosomal protein L6
MLYSGLILKRGTNFVKKNNSYIIKGPLGNSLSILINNNVSIIENSLTVLVQSYNKRLFFLYFRLLKQKVIGVLFGFRKKLRLEGLGFIAVFGDGVLVLKLGFSHVIRVVVPKTLKVFIKKRKRITVLGSDLNEITQFSLKLRNYKSPEIYKGKGVRYFRERLKLKIGKKV